VILPALVHRYAVNIFRLLQKENPSVPLPISSFREAHAERWRIIRMRTLAERAQAVGTLMKIPSEPECAAAKITIELDEVDRDARQMVGP
jgi:hypothetical protein